MANFWIPDRVDRPELMDAPRLANVEIQDAYRVLRRVNRQLGNLRTARLEFLRFLEEDMADGSPASVVDLGSGSGDIPLALRRLAGGRSAQIIALDRDKTAVAEAFRQNLSVVCGDALRLPFADRSIDLVTAVKFAHHFSGDSLTRLILEMTRVAGRRVIVLDIRRHRLAYWGFLAWSRLLTSNRLVRYDGPLSVLRGFTRDELLLEAASITGFSWEVRSYAGFQLALVGRRLTRSERVARSVESAVSIHGGETTEA